MPSPRRATRRPHAPRLGTQYPALGAWRSAFTLLELLVVMGIIVLLAAILVPVVSQVRMRGYVVSTQGQMQRIAAALDAYYHDFKSFPGPIPNSQLFGQTGASLSKQYTITTTQTPAPAVVVAQINSSENLVLGLLGILSTPTAPGGPVVYSGLPPVHDVVGLNPLRPASYHYIDYIPEELSFPSGFAYSNRLGGSMTGAGTLPTDVTVQSGANQAAPETVGDSPVPEFMDRIPDFMPILYIRANVGVQPDPTTPGSGIASATASPTHPVQYDASQLAPYGFLHVSSIDFVLPTGVTVGSGDDPGFVAYFMNPAISGQARGKDGFVLISAGADRLYGTKDDIIVTP